ncbi:MAG: hypothetical protein AB1490_01420 [Pseudomonadota bacterium]
MTNFVRPALLIDAAASAATAALLIAGTNLLEAWLNIPAVVIREAGLILVPYIGLVAIVATRPQISTRAVWIIIACNALWTAASFAILAFISPNGLGVVFVIGQALAVAALGVLQWAALRRGAISVA